MREKRRKRGKGTAGLSGEFGLNKLHAFQQKPQFLVHPIQWGGREREDTRPIHTLPELLLTFASMVNRKGTTEFLDH